MKRMISIPRMVFRRTVLIQKALVERMVQKVASYIALLLNDIRTAYVRHETASRGFMQKEHKQEAFSPIKL